MCQASIRTFSPNQVRYKNAQRLFLAMFWHFKIISTDTMGSNFCRASLESYVLWASRKTTASGGCQTQSMNHLRDDSSQTSM